jgi:hypothetical protein
MFRAAAGLVVASVASSTVAGAGSPAGAHGAAGAGVRPESDVKLSLSAPTTRGTWTMRVTNGGDVPVRVAADARVLELDVTARGARTPMRCALPEDMRPENGDLERPLVLPPGRSYLESFEARLYCFGAAKGASLAPGSIVVARLGWGGKHPSSFEVAPIDGVEPRIAAQGTLEALPIVLPDEPTAGSPSARAASGAPAEDQDVPKLAVVAGRWVDVESASSVEIPVSLRNDGTHAVVVRFRPEVLRFDVVGPGGADHCTWPAQMGAPSREQFTTLGPGATTTLSATLPTYCDTHTFDRGGVFFVRAHVDTRQTSGGLVGVRAFEGELVATDATVVRLHRGRAPSPLARPKLEEP